MAETELSRMQSEVQGSFTDIPAGSTVQPCPSWIELRFVPKPMPEPAPSEPGSGEQTFKDRYLWVLKVNGSKHGDGKLDMRKGSVIRYDDLPCGTCSIEIDFPSFGSGVRAFWRKDWPSHVTVKKVEFKDLKTGMVHIFDIINELRAVAEYMAAEMKNNAASGHAWFMSAQNTAGQVPGVGALNKGAALAHWTERVAPGRPWDHKPHFTSQKIGETKPGSWHTWGEWEYFLDAWSNIHYGYVGRAAGFSRDTLLLGANAQQLVHSVTGGGTTGGDPEQDALAIKMGSDMYDQGATITPELLIEKVVRTPQFDRRPHSYESATGAGDQATLRKR
ncbi:polymorphic toxin type 44 domain-containing protein [Chondromyces apiculatus]|uniref:Bacterial toxin 44 domain-containing protein n=1 Tax=Chondromyces apiculatus DSM 436 TaxID=1192034 RepID=A0A017TCW0_9BACT|nr:polymorphic toxin type 44 domain-containing protein [Chondromyces apiculatus]EYF07113.1 Hypothetical protein CAP_0592 [Chondromyces apiculatus DSM 436]